MRYAALVLHVLDKLCYVCFAVFAVLLTWTLRRRRKMKKALLH